jgi:hypothetical protein
MHRNQGNPVIRKIKVQTLKSHSSDTVVCVCEKLSFLLL